MCICEYIHFYNRRCAVTNGDPCTLNIRTRSLPDITTSRETTTCTTSKMSKEIKNNNDHTKLKKKNRSFKFAAHNRTKIIRGRTNTRPQATTL